MDPTRVAVVTGGAKGIGRACALRLAEDGCDVAILDVLADEGRQATEAVRSKGRRSLFVELDVSDEERVEAAFRLVVAELGALRVLINAAGIIGKDSQGVLSTPVAEWRRVNEVNASGTYFCIRAALPYMVEAGWGRIVNFTSAARHGSPNLLPYCVSKAGVVAITGGVAAEFTSKGILVNAVQPGRVKTDMVLTRVPKEQIEHPGVAIGRLAEPEELAEVVCFLASERNTYMSGAIVPVMGGPSWSPR